MKKIVFISVFLFFVCLIFSQSKNVFAVEGTCSWHGGVNCSAGADLDGSAICNDGWSDSSEIYSQQQICSIAKYGCSNSQDIYAKYGLSVKLEVMDSFLKQMNGLYDDCIAKANAMTDIRDKTIQVLQCSIDNTGRQTQYNSLSVDYDNTKRSADAECEQSGRIELENYEKRLKSEYGYYSTEKNTPEYTCPANSTLNGTMCFCNDGYVYDGSACITYTQSCQAKYGANSYGDKQYCHCSAGYEWNSSQTTCNKVEIQPTKNIQDDKKIASDETIATLVKKEKSCDVGYVLLLNKGTCIKIPDHAHAVESTTDIWQCDEGYKEINNKCSLINQGILNQQEELINKDNMNKNLTSELANTSNLESSSKQSDNIDNNQSNFIAQKVNKLKINIISAFGNILKKLKFW